SAAPPLPGAAAPRLADAATPASGAADDPAAPDGAAPALLLRAALRAEERYAYLAALAAAPVRILSFPRADTAAQQALYPSRWLLEAAARLEGRPLSSAELVALAGRPWLTVVASAEAAVAAAARTAEADLHDHDLGRLLRWRAAGRPLETHYLAASTPLGRALVMERRRAAGSFCEWTGDLSGLARTVPRLALADGAPVAATRLEIWASCPFRYFLEHVLRIEVLERPEALATIPARERGGLVHRILQRFVEEARQRGRLPAPGQPWDDAHRQRLVEIAREEFADAERRGVTGKARLWEVAQAEILADLAAFLDEDARLRQRYGVTPFGVELRFGFPAGDGERPLPAPAWPLPGGGTVRFRGVIDRLDVAPDGRRALVLDYKTGRIQEYQALDRDALDRGRRLQLPVYALAARALLGDGAEVGAAYWFVDARGE
ncbi:MAG TPA: PD-(D/E)XK nuclease family protein, partial [Thermodesulfobacteriota bacterium]|nr:PD-(D/E)XK nuclease family protein [Thermodesulfobacteriota bacterium]